MKEENRQTSSRKDEHLDLCLKENVDFFNKTSGFEKYDFIHYAITEIDINDIDLSSYFLNKKISYPFLISCMTGGTEKTNKVNFDFAEIAKELNIVLGLGSQRILLEDSSQLQEYKKIRTLAGNIPLLGNIGIDQINKIKDIDSIKILIDSIEADGLVVHLNPVQEMLQPEGKFNFKGFLKNAEKLISQINIPFIAKEVGSGISKDVADKLLSIGFKTIDVAGAGGTSWSGIEILRNNNKDSEFWNWGLPTTYCIKEVSQLKNKYNFSIIGSGGINNPFDSAKAYALGADFTASARTILKKYDEVGKEKTTDFINEWFLTVKKIMYLTNSSKLTELKNKIVKKEELF